MIFFKDPADGGRVYAYSADGTEDSSIKPGLMRMSAEEVALHKRPPPTANGLCRQIDSAADLARHQVAGDPLRAVEYERAAAEARSFADAGYPAGDVPRSVAAWTMNGRSAKAAADEMLAEAEAYTEALYQLRETRLAAKEQVRALIAAGENEKAQNLTISTINAIQLAVAGIGNAKE